MLARVVRDGDRRFVNAYLAALIRRKKFGGLLRSRQADVMSAAFVAWAGLVSEYRPRAPFSAWISNYLGLRICPILGKEFPLDFTEPLDFDVPADAPAAISDRERLFVEAVAARSSHGWSHGQGSGRRVRGIGEYRIRASVRLPEKPQAPR